MKRFLPPPTRYSSDVSQSVQAKIAQPQRPPPPTSATLGVIQCMEANPLERLSKANVAFTESNILFAVPAPSGVDTVAGVIFLEKGTGSAGWVHIKARHSAEFIACGYNDVALLALLQSSLAKPPDRVETNSRGYTISYLVQGDGGSFALNIAVSKNGFIVTSHPSDQIGSVYFSRISKSPDTFIRLGGLAGYSNNK